MGLWDLELELGFEFFFLFFGRDSLVKMRYLVVAFGFAALVAGHGFIENATIGGKHYDVCLA
jgi:hypothetical protein